MEQILTSINDFLYIYVLVILLLAAGIYFSIRTGFVQFRLFRDGIKTLTTKEKSREGITSFQALMISTASRVGTGNIVGISTAIAIGGSGSIFWMWLMALLGAASAFCESTLAQIYKVKSGKEFHGGPAYYIERGLGQKWLGILYAILLIICVGFGWNTTTSYNMSAALIHYIPNYKESMAPTILGVILVILVGAVIFGGASRIGKLSSIAVPAMSVIYIIFGLICVIANIQALPGVIAGIFREAFDLSSITGGIAGSCIVQGMKRGLFSNEAGMGTGANAAAAAECDHPVQQGLGQMLSVFLDTLIICTITALILLISGVEGTKANAGSPFVQEAVSAILGEAGIFVITVALMLFAFTTLIGNYFYAEQNLKFITENKAVLVIFRILALAVIFTGTGVSFDMAWNITDIFMGLVAIVNIVAVFALRKPIFDALKDFEQKREHGKYLDFEASEIGLENTDCWK